MRLMDGDGSGFDPAALARRWRLPLSPTPDADRLLVPWWIPPLFLLFALGLAPWVAWLFISLPDAEVANHWRLAWGGFDLFLAVGLAATGVALVRRSPLAEIFAAMTAALLLSDAWFDTMTSRGTLTLAIAVAEAVLCEIPLAIVCLWIARNIERVLSDARPFLERAGFRIGPGGLLSPEKRPDD